MITPEFKTADGQRFPTWVEAHKHIAEHPELALVGMTYDEVMAAIRREDADRADALERVGTRIGRERRDDGDLKFKRKVPQPTLSLAPPSADPPCSMEAA